jgi:hypothetical protein
MKATSSNEGEKALQYPEDPIGESVDFQKENQIPQTNKKLVLVDITRDNENKSPVAGFHVLIVVG